VGSGGTETWKQRKIAVSLAVIGAIAAPLVFHTYQERPMTHALVPMTANEKATIAARLKETNNPAHAGSAPRTKELG
jgi:flagellar biosynthesis/type III secretory pathway M-ring protein FliF/YscJ